MRLLRLLLIVLLCGTGMALAAPLKLTPHIGFNGYYRVRTLVPVTVEVENTGDTIKGEFRVTAASPGVLSDSCRTMLTIPRGTKQTYTLYILPESFSPGFTVEFWSRKTLVTSSTITRCQEVADVNRLVVIVGGEDGTSLHWVTGQSITTPDMPVPRPWDFMRNGNWSRGPGYSVSPVPYRYRGGPTGQVELTYVPPAWLPDNPEAYGSVSMLVLMSDITENSFPQVEVREAIPVWVASGGHLMIAGGGVPARLQNPFFTSLLPLRNGKPLPGAEVLTNVDGGTAVTALLGAGRVTALSYDPDAVFTRDITKASRFYGKLVEREPRPAITLNLRNAISEAITVRNLRPPDLKLIVVFLLVYLVLLVPVNYFVLKKLDKREMAWLTTPVIVAVFTVGAYGIGYMTKGHRLVLNQFTLIETAGQQPNAEAISALLIFSPARTNYDMDLGDTGLMVRELSGRVEENPYYGGGSPYSGERRGQPLALNVQGIGGPLSVSGIHVNMWDFRQFAMAHRMSLGEGFTANLKDGGPTATPRATGTVHNGTPYRFFLCELYKDGAPVANFTLNPGNTVTVEKASAPKALKLNEDEQHMFDAMQGQLKGQLGVGGPLGKGFVMIGYTHDARPPVRVSNHAPTTNMTVVVSHL